MKYILCYGDSNTWGCVPEVFTRYEFGVRWPGVMQQLLGPGFHVYENALNGRTTVFEDPIEEGRNGRANFEVTLMQNAPLDLVILMLGTNDTKIRFLKQPWDIAWGLDLLVDYIQKSHAGRDAGTPQILIAAPIHITDDWGKSLHDTVFDQTSIAKSKQLAACYEFVAKLRGCAFIDAAQFAAASGDGVHMTAAEHQKLGQAMADRVRAMLG